METRNIYLWTGFIVLTLIVITGCSTLVVRWPDQSIEKGDRELSLYRAPDILNDFLWTTPPIYGREVVFENGTARVNFDNEEIIFSLQDGKMQLIYDIETQMTEPVITARNYYYDIDILGTKTVMKQQYVSENYWDTERVQVMKTRTVSKYVPVQKTRTVYDPITESWRTEYYTDYEWQTQTETYWDWEDRQVYKTRWVWKTIAVRVIDIPEYAVYFFSLEDGNKIAIYEIEEDGDRRYYFQNLSYFYSIETEKGFWGNENEIKLIFIDANSNGNFFDKDDMLLFNTWNPYAKDSSYQEITSFMDNYWYRIEDLQRDVFLTFSTNDNKTSLSIINANTRYIGTKEKGKITLTNLDEYMIIYINGKEYSGIKKGTFTGDIEYGMFNLQIINHGFLPFEKVFVVDSDHPEVEIAYSQMDPAGTFIFIDHNFNNWKIEFKNEDGETRVYFNQETVSIEPGSYTVMISADGNTFIKEVTITQDGIIEYNFSEDTLIEY